MAITSSTLPDLSALDHEALKSLVLAQQAELLAQHELLSVRDTQIEHLKLMIIQLRRMQFGGKSEKLDRKIEQLELQLEDPEARRAESLRHPPIPRLRQQKQRAVRYGAPYLSTSHVKSEPSRRSRKPAPTAAAR